MPSDLEKEEVYGDFIYDNIKPSPRIDYDGDGIEEKIPTKIVKSSINLRDALGDEAEYDYSVELQLVPTKLTEEHKQDVMNSIGINESEWQNEDVRAWAIKEYGLGVPLWNKTGDNVNKLLEEADEQVRPISAMIGFYLDRAVNRVGSTGWDMLRDALTNESWIDAGLRRIKKQRNKQKLDDEV